MCQEKNAEKLKCGSVQIDLSNCKSKNILNIHLVSC